MSEDRMIRVDNLKLLLKERGWSKADLARALGVSDAYAGKLVDGVKPFGEKAARGYEPKLGKPRNWLDEVHTGGEYSDETLQELHAHASFAPVKPDGSSAGHPVNTLNQPVHSAIRTGPAVFPFSREASDVKKSRRAPVVEWVRLGSVLFTENAEVEAASFLPVPDEASGYCKWVVLETDLPRFGLRRGYKVAIEPVHDPIECMEGELYVFKTIGDSFFLGEFRRLAREGFEAVPESGHPLDSLRHGVKVLGRHAGTWK